MARLGAPAPFHGEFQNLVLALNVTLDNVVVPSIEFA
jgi:hypothetical protein